MNRLVKRALPLRATAVIAPFLSVIFAGEASAHVKWFCAYDVAGQPRGLENVLCLEFELLVGLAILSLTAGCLLERTAVGDALQRALNLMTSGLQSNTELLVRVVCGFFFVALWTSGGILLTPELKTTSAAISWLQLAIAAGLLSRRTMPLSALGIAVLFALALRDYGVFHLADYPIFLSIAAYLALTGLQRDLFGVRALDVMRYGAAITLMWASIEKWAYPEWSFPLFIEHPALTLGFDDDLLMRAAGVIEFTLAFALLWTPLVRRSAAIILAGMFIAAIFEFGKLDMIGHAPIVAVLLAIGADNIATTKQPRRFVLAAPATYCIALAGFLTIYYVVHAALFGTNIL